MQLFAYESENENFSGILILLKWKQNKRLLSQRPTQQESLTGAQVNLKGHGKGPGKNLTRKVQLKHKTVVNDGELPSWSKKAKGNVDFYIKESRNFSTL